MTLWGGRVGFGAKPAVVVIDLARYWLDPQQQLGSQLDSVVEAACTVLKAARAARVPILFTTFAYDPAEHPTPHDRKLQFQLPEAAQRRRGNGARFFSLPFFSSSPYPILEMPTAPTAAPAPRLLRLVRQAAGRLFDDIYGQGCFDAAWGPTMHSEIATRYGNYQDLRNGILHRGGELTSGARIDVTEADIQATVRDAEEFRDAILRLSAWCCEWWVRVRNNAVVE
jgi:nicotinamidase-related amidase